MTVTQHQRTRAHLRRRHLRGCGTHTVPAPPFSLSKLLHRIKSPHSSAEEHRSRELSFQRPAAHKMFLPRAGNHTSLQRSPSHWSSLSVPSPRGSPASTSISGCSQGRAVSVDELPPLPHHLFLPWPPLPTAGRLDAS